MSYFVRKLEDISNGKGVWESQRIGIFQEVEGHEKQIGEYTRNYPAFYKTFCFFTRNGKDYALYSRDYTSTRLMALPSCEDIGGEDHDFVGFCPVDYFVPTVEDEPEDEQPMFGFVAGCVWGDDSSWKIQYIDLSQIEQGIIKREDRFGYIELPSNMDLKDAIRYGDMDSNYITIVTQHTFDIRTGKAEE